MHRFTQILKHIFDTSFNVDIASILLFQSFFVKNMLFPREHLMSFRFAWFPSQVYSEEGMYYYLGSRNPRPGASLFWGF